MIIQRTNAYCTECETTHPATIEKRAKQIVAFTECPRGITEHQISSNADIYLDLYRRFEKRETELFPTTRHILNYIPITDACNFSCKVCGANAKHGTDANFLDKDQIISRLHQIKRDGGVLANFFGGEATLHPDILEVVKAAHCLGLNTGIATNGYKLGTNLCFVQELKEAGLDRACLQFDSFNRESLRKLGRDYLEEKLKAIDYCKNEGIKFGLNSTVSRINIAELPEVMDFALRQIPRIFNMSLLSMAPIGRHEEAKDDISVFREEIIETILVGWKKYGVTLDDIVHLPSFLPWSISIHPDCGASLVMAKNGESIYPLNHILNLEKLFTLMGRCKWTDFKVRGKLALSIYILRSLRPTKTITTIRLGLSMLFGCDRSGILNFGLTNYKSLYFQDEEKIKHCTCRFYTASGAIKGCHHYARPDDFPGSTAHQQKHDLL
jgi:MoaA/NifB/PqqE/SkfB family radical SAM enzyme